MKKKKKRKGIKCRNNVRLEKLGRAMIWSRTKPKKKKEKKKLTLVLSTPNPSFSWCNS